MELLHFLEQLRTPLGDTFFSLITNFGGETLFIVAGLLGSDSADINVNGKVGFAGL